MTEQELRETLRRIRAGSIDAEQDIWDWWKQVTSSPSKPLRCLRCGTIDAFGAAHVETDRLHQALEEIVAEIPANQGGTQGAIRKRALAALNEEVRK